MADHLNSKGFKPKIRIYVPHQKGVFETKIAKLASNGVSLALMMRDRGQTMGLAALATIVALGKGAVHEPVVVGMGCSDSGAWYVDTAGCAMLQADNANPPPRQGFVRKAMQYAAVLLLGLMLLVGSASCKKDPQPNPTPGPTPTDTITPGVPGDTITPIPGDTIVPEPPMPMDTVKLSIKINNENGVEILYPSLDTIRKLIDLNKVVVLRWKIPPNWTANWTPQGFRYPRDSLKPRFALSENIIGSGKIYVDKNYGGASIPCEDSLNISKLGMTECDSAIFAGWGFEPYVKYAKSQSEEHFKMLKAIGMSRAILGKQH